MQKRTATLVLPLVLLLCPLFAGRGAAQTGSISGTVTAASGGATLSGVTINVYTNAGSLRTSVLTGGAGSYTASGLTAGTYYLQAIAGGYTSPSYVPTLYPSSPCANAACEWTRGTTVTVTAGGTTPGVNFSLATLAAAPNDTATTAVVASPAPFIQAVSTTAATASVEEPVPGCGNGSKAASVWYRFTAPALGTVTVDTFGTDYDTVVSVYSGAGWVPPAPPPAVPGACNDDSSVNGVTVPQSKISTTMTAGSERYFMVSSYDGGAGTLVFHLTFTSGGAGLRGRVVAQGTSTGLPGIGVVVYDGAGQQAGGGITDASGYYAVVGLAAGTYYARTSNTAGYVEQAYNGIACSAGLCSPTSGSPIAVTAGSVTNGIDFSLTAGARISGTVRAAGTGDPLGDVELDVYSSSGAYLTNGRTNASGVYASGTGLPAGSYYVRTYVSGTYLNQIYSGINCGFSCPSVTLATAVSVTAGATTSGIDFSLTTGGVITGRVTKAADATALSGVRVYVYTSSGSNVASWMTGEDGVFTTDIALPTGSYYVRTSNSSGLLDFLYSGIPCPGGSCTVTTGTAVAVAAGATTSAVDFALPAGGRITGTVKTASGGAAVTGARVYVYTSTGILVGFWTTDASGAFATAVGLSTGNYYLRTYNTAGLTDQLYNGVECPGGACTVTSGTPVSVTLGATTSGINFLLPAGGRVSGTVTAAATGSPVSGVEVDVYNTAGAFVTLGTTNSSGVYTTLAGLPTGNYYLRTYNSAGLFNQVYSGMGCGSSCPAVTTGTPLAVTAGSTATANFTLASGGGISGTVTGPGGAPLAGVKVTISSTAGATITTATTSASGSYSTGSVLATGSYYVHTTNTLGYVDQLYPGRACGGGGCLWTSGTPVNVTQGSTTTGIGFALTLGGSIGGTVTDASNAAGIPSAQLDVYDSHGSLIQSVVTNLSGAYSTSTGLATGSYYVIANASGYVGKLYASTPCAAGTVCNPLAGTAIPVTLGATTSGINLALNRGGLITGMVTDASDDSPLPSIEVDVFDRNDNYVSSGYSDYAGHYTATGLEGGTYYVRTYNAQGYVNELYADVPCTTCTPSRGTPVAVVRGATTPGIDFSLAKGGIISGTVTAAGSGVPLVSVSVRAYTSTGALAASAYTDGAGRYSFSSYGGLATGSYFVATSNSQGYVDLLYGTTPCSGSCEVTAGTPVAVTQGATTSGIDFSLPLGGSITGRVTDGNSAAPLAGVVVMAYDNAGRAQGSATTNSLGYYTRNGLAAGHYFLRTSSTLGYIDQRYSGTACPGGGCEITAGTTVNVTQGGTTSGIDFALRPEGGTITGSVTEAGSALPLLGVTVAVYDAAGRSVGSVTTDFAGVYRKSGLPAGTYYLGTHNSLGYMDQAYSGIPCDDYGSAACPLGAPVTVTAWTTTSGVNFRLMQGGSISGTVTDADTSLPIPNQTLQLFAATGGAVASASTDGAGRYRFEGLNAGTYYVGATGTEYVDVIYPSLICPLMSCAIKLGAGVVVAAGTGTQGVDFALHKGGTIAGTVRRAGPETPIANVLVQALNASGVVQAGGYTNSQGEYRLLGLQAGSFYVQAQAPSLGYVGEVYSGVTCPGEACDLSAGTLIPVTVGQTTPSINFRLSATAGAITGFVTNATTGGAVWSSVSIGVYDSQGRLAGSASTSYGRYTVRGLPAGSYRVQTRNASGYANQAYPSVACAGECNPATQGTPVTVVATQTTSGIDFALTLAGEIKGRVRDGLTDAGLEDVSVVIHNAGGTAIATVKTSASGDYSAPGLGAGTYFVKTPGAAGHVGQLYQGMACPSGSCTVTTGTPVVVGGVESVAVGIDFALQSNALAFTDVPLEARGTRVKAVHITELRQAIDQLRTRYSLPAYAWTDSPLVPGVTPIRAVHLQQLRAALNDVYSAAGRTAPSYTTPSLTAGATAISAAHVAELRVAILALW